MWFTSFKKYLATTAAPRHCTIAPRSPRNLSANTSATTCGNPFCSRRTRCLPCCKREGGGDEGALRYFVHVGLLLYVCEYCASFIILSYIYFRMYGDHLIRTHAPTIHSLQQTNERTRICASLERRPHLCLCDSEIASESQCR